MDIKLSAKEVLNFSPKINQSAIALRPDELTWTSNFAHGVFAFYRQGDLEYFGISFQGYDTNSPYLWQIPRKYLEPRGKGNICCVYPIKTGTFQPLAVPSQQLAIFRHLLAIAAAIEKADRPSLILLYDNFIQKYGFVANYRSYFEGTWWIDLRLVSLLWNLEAVVEVNGSVVNVVKGSLFEDSSFQEQIIYPSANCENSVENQLKEALDLVVSWHGEVNLPAIAHMVDLPVEIVGDHLREMKLIFREID